MKTKFTSRLNKETIRELSPSELKGARGGLQTVIIVTTGEAVSCPCVYTITCSRVVCSWLPTCTCGCVQATYTCKSDTCAPTYTCGCRMPMPKQ